MKKLFGKMNHLVLAGCALVATAGIANAQGATDLGTRAASWKTQATAVADLLPVVGVIGGLGLLIAAGIKLAKHNSDPREHSMKAVMLFAAGGIILLFLGAFTAFGGQTIFGGTGNNSGSGGTGTFQGLGS